MKKVILIILALWCGQVAAQNSDKEQQLINLCLKGWKQIMDQNDVEYQSHLQDLRKLEFGPMRNDHALAYTNRWGEKIILSRKILSSGPYTIMQTFFHEMGHYYGLEHTDYGIMKEQVYREEEIEQNWNRWEAEYCRAMKNRNR